MLLAQDPKLLLVDEPAAGMTDEETHRTGELLLSLAGKHSIVVIEHDMTFVRQIARDARSPCSTRAPCSARAKSTKCRPTRRSSRSISAAANTATPMSALLQLSAVETAIGGSRILRGVDARGERRRGRRPHGPQRRRQDDDAEIHHRRAAGARAARSRFDGQRIDQACRPTPAPGPASATCRRAAIFFRT